MSVRWARQDLDVAERFYRQALSRHEDAALGTSLALIHLWASRATQWCCGASLPLPAASSLVSAYRPAQAHVDVTNVRARPPASDGAEDARPPGAARGRPGTVRASPETGTGSLAPLRPNAAVVGSRASVSLRTTLVSADGDEALWDLVLISVILVLGVAVMRRRRLGGVA